MLPILEPNEKYGFGLGVLNRFETPSWNFFRDASDLSVPGNMFHNRVVAGINDRWKLVVLFGGSVSVL